MRFLYPLGLWGLIGIPILILIYIIKNKYTEQTVSSTYLWTLSERFLKRKNPLTMITGLIALVLQILAVAAISIAIAHPVFTLKNAARQYYFMLDSSGSMAAEQDGSSLFEQGKGRIREMIQDSANGSTYTLVCVGDTYEVLCENYGDKNDTLLMLEELQAGGGDAALDEALLGAQNAFTQNSGLEMYFFTDKNYNATANVTLVNLSNVEQNYAISDFAYSTKTDSVIVTANVISYESDKELTVELYKDGETTAFATQTVSLSKGEKKGIEPITFEGSFHRLDAVIVDEDGQMLDNRSTLFSAESQSGHRALLVSDAPFFLQTALRLAEKTAVEQIATEDYKGQSGYDLYIFDCFNPQVMPKDGAVWLINLDGNLAQSGFSAYGENQIGDGGQLKLTTSTATGVQALLKDLVNAPVYIDSYQKYGALQYSSEFQILYTYNKSPMVFVGKNGYGNREAVFAFDLHKSSFPLTIDYVMLIRNILEYSFPKILERDVYDCGETLEINPLSDCLNIEVISPSGEKELKTLNTIDNYRLAEVGVYTIKMNTNSGSKTFNVYAQLPETERAPMQTEAAFCINGERTDGRTDGKYDRLILIFALLSVMFIADWVVYCYDKYQLR